MIGVTEVDSCETGTDAGMLQFGNLVGSSNQQACLIGRMFIHFFHHITFLYYLSSIIVVSKIKVIITNYKISIKKNIKNVASIAAKFQLYIYVDIEPKPVLLNFPNQITTNLHSLSTKQISQIEDPVAPRIATCQLDLLVVQSLSLQPLSTKIQRVN